MDISLIGGALVDLFDLEAVVGLVLLALVIGVLLHGMYRDSFGRRSEGKR